MKHSRLYTGMAIALASSFAAVPLAQAQLEEVIVTAERREASLQDTDIAISVFSSEAITELGVQSYLDLAALAPNVLMHEMPGKAGGAIAIRGFKNAETISTFEPKVALYLDGVLLAKGAGSVFDVVDLERVEILRGPQGTLYGRNTVGGAVNFITKKPSIEEVSGNVQVTAGDYDQLDLKGTINVPLGDSFAVKASAAKLERDGYFDDNVGNRELGDKDREVFHIQAMWEPTDRLNFLYAYDQTEIDETQYPLQLVEYNPTYRPTFGQWVDDGSSNNRNLDGPSSMEADIDGHSLTIDWGLSDSLTLVSISALRSFDVDNNADSDGAGEWAIDNASGDDVETFTQELRLVGSGERLEYVLGAFYMDEDIKETYSFTNINFAGGYYSGTTASAKNEIWAIFGEATYGLTDNFDITAGLRYTEEDKEMQRTDYVDAPGLGASDLTIPLPDAQRDFDDVSGTVSLSYRWTDDVMTYFKVSKGYVSGGFNPRAPNSDPELFVLGYDEETVYTYELGWKTDWWDNRLRVNGAIFYNDYEDLQVNQLTPSGDNNIDNAGDAEITGIELEFIVLPTENLEIGGGYGYLDPEYKTYINEGLPGDPSDDVDLSNNHWAHAPENMVNLYARYVVPDVLGGELAMRVDYAWVDDYFLLTANGPDLLDGNTAPSYDFVNARIGLNNIGGPGGTNFSVALWGKNLTDETWYTSGYDLTDGIVGIAAKATAPPRTYGVDLKLEF